MTNISKGRIGEAIASAILLQFGFEVYTAEVDIYGTDFIIIPPNNSEKRLRVQVKSIPSYEKGFRISKSPQKVDYYLLVVADLTKIKYWFIPNGRIAEITKDLPDHKNIKDKILKIDEDAWKQHSVKNELARLSDSHKFEFHASRTGKVGEYLATAMLLEKNFEVTQVVADDNNVDLVMRESGEWKSVQVKYSSSSFSFRNIKKSNTDKNMFYLFIGSSKNNKALKEFFLVPVVNIEPGKSGGFSLSNEIKNKYKIGEMNFNQTDFNL